MDDDEIPSAYITGLQFGLVTDDDIEKWRLPEIKNMSSKKNPSILGTINCPSLGPANANSLCLTCGNSFEHCQGHPAKITLVDSVLNVNYIPILLKIFPTLCIRCMRILAPDDLLQRLAQNKNPDMNNYRKCVNDLHKLCSKTNRICWFPRKKSSGDTKQSENDEYEEPHLLPYEEAQRRGYCGAVQPHIWLVYEKFMIRPAWYLRTEEEYYDLPIITPHKLHAMLRYVTRSLIRLYGFNSKHSPLHGMMVSKMYVPPTLTRVPRQKDDLSSLLENIMLYNKQTKDKLEAPVPPGEQPHVLNLTLGLVIPPTMTNVPSTTLSIKERAKMRPFQGPMSKLMLRKKVPVISDSLEFYYKLQREVAVFYDSKYNTTLDREHERNNVLCLRKRFASKNGDHGRVRRDMLGKPSDFGLRSVSSPNTAMDIDEVGIPLRAAMVVTTPEVVTPYNFNEMLMLVMNGKNKYPGCNFVEIDGQLFASNSDFGGLKLGYVVHRHLRNGDRVIANRAPSLHRFAIMGYRVRVHPFATINGHLSVTRVLNEDYDGDEKNVYVPQSLLVKAEVADLITVRKNLLRDGELVIGIVQHGAIGAACITNEKNGPMVFTKQEIQQHIMDGNDDVCRKEFLHAWDKFNNFQQLTGREFMRLLLPTYNGTFVLNKNSLNECIRETIDTPEDMCHAAQRIGFITRILENVASLSGTSVLLDDMLFENSEDTKREGETSFENAIKFATQKKYSLLQQQQHTSSLNDACNTVALPPTFVDQVSLEDDICRLLDIYRDVLGKPVLESLKHKRGAISGIHTIIASKAKGDETSVVQNLQVVGQQNNEHSVRYPDSTSHYYRNECSKYGFVKHGLIDSLTPTEYFFMLRSGRVGLVRTNGETSKVGYEYRKIFKYIEDERMCFANTVRDSNGRVILYYYGYDTTFLRTQRLESVIRTIPECVAFFATSNDVLSIMEVEHLLLLRQRVVTATHLQLNVLMPIHFDKRCENVFCDNQKNHHQCYPVTLNAARNRVCKLWNQLVLKHFIPSSPMHELCFFEQLSTRFLRDRGYLNCAKTFNAYLQHVEHILASNVCSVGDACGMKCSQDTTQPGTQAGLSLFHIAGEKTTVVEGTARFKEIINLPKQLQQPMMQIYFLPEIQDSFDPMVLVELRLEYIIERFKDELFWDDEEDAAGDILQSCAETKWKRHLEKYGMTLEAEHKLRSFCPQDHDELVHLTIFLNKQSMHRRELSPRAIVLYLKNVRMLQYDAQNIAITCSHLENDIWWVAITVLKTSPIWKIIAPQTDLKCNNLNPKLASMLMDILKSDRMLLAGIEGIRDFKWAEKKFLVADPDQDGKIVTITRKLILTQGSNMQAICSLPGIDLEFTCSNDILQMYNVYGIDVAQATISEGLMEALNITYDNPSVQHVKIIAATMCFSGYPLPLNYSGMTARGTTSWLQRALFERSYESFLGVGIVGHEDNVRGVSSAVIVGAPISLGTGGDFQVLAPPITNQKPTFLEKVNASSLKHEGKSTEAIFLQRKAKPASTLQLKIPNIAEFLQALATGELYEEDTIVFDLQFHPDITTTTTNEFGVLLSQAFIKPKMIVASKKTRKRKVEWIADESHQQQFYLSGNKGQDTFIPSSPVAQQTLTFQNYLHFRPSSP